MSTRPVIAVNHTSNMNRTAKKLASVVALTMLLAGCEAKNVPTASPFDLLGPLLNAPISAPLAALGIRLDEGATSVPDLHANPRALEGLDLPSRILTQRNLAYALEEGRLRVGVYWENPANRGGRAAGVATVMQEMTHEDGRRCREVLIETEMESEATDKRLLTYCHSEAGWLIVD